MSLLDLTASRPGFADRIRRRVGLARLALWWERLWPALWPAIGIIGAFAAVALLGVFGYVGTNLRIPMLLAVLGTSGWFLWKRFERFREPSHDEAARRLERDSGLIHRPITERGDKLAVGKSDTVTEQLWHEHTRLMLSRRDRLKLVVPHPKLAERDPYYLRYLVLLLLAVGLLVSGSDWSRRLVAAFSLSGTGTSTATLDAWLDPPSYTGIAPIYLPRGDRSASPIAAPTGSAIALRVHAPHSEPTVVVMPRQEKNIAFSGENDDYAANGKITRDARVNVVAGGETVGSWQIRAVPDRPPTVAFATKPSRTERDAVKFDFTVQDDYGVVSARALITPVKNSAHQKVLAVDLPLSSTSKSAHEIIYRDLTAEPYAGLDVNVVLEAKDGAGNISHSAPMKFTLPAHVFTNPLARALVEQRQNLSLDNGAGVNTAMHALDALTYAPEKFFDDKTDGAYLAMRAAYWGLKTSQPDIKHVQDLLWQAALGLERGGLSDAAAQLRQLQQLLSQAIAQGAPQAVIDALLERYQQALNRYLQMLAQNPPPASQPIPPGAKVLKPEDLQALLKAIEQLAQTGNREQAQQLLAMLQSMLENLHMTAGAGGSQQDNAQNKALQGLSDLMGKQRDLMDKTYREQQGNPDPKAGGPKGLSDQQGQLKDQLNQLMQGLGKDGGPGGKKLGEAGKSMGEAQGQLGSRSLDEAQQSEKKALDAMREGAGALAKQMMQQNGQGQQEGGNEDPLGREGNGAFGSGVKIPDKSAMERARNILKELRKRAEERGRPKEELDYIDRLLKQF